MSQIIPPPPMFAWEADHFDGGETVRISLAVHSSLGLEMLDTETSTLVLWFERFEVKDPERDVSITGLDWGVMVYGFPLDDIDRGGEELAQPLASGELWQADPTIAKRYAEAVARVFLEANFTAWSIKSPA